MAHVPGPALSSLEEQVIPTEPDAEGGGGKLPRATPAAIGYARANEAPTIGVAPGVGSVRESANQPCCSPPCRQWQRRIRAALDMDYRVDLRGASAAASAASEQAQASAADIEGVRLGLTCGTGHGLHSVCACGWSEELLDNTIKAYRTHCSFSAAP